MTSKQLQSLITAGVFSAALLTGVAYADDSTMPAATAPAPAASAPASDASPAASTTPTGTPVKHHKHSKKMLAKHGCKGQNDCKGQGGCKAGDAGCKGQNSCKGKGGCATDGSKAAQ